MVDQAERILPIPEVAKRTGLSRSVIGKWIEREHVIGYEIAKPPGYSSPRKYARAVDLAEIERLLETFDRPQPQDDRGKYMAGDPR